jgi:hypothetical protein
MIHVAKPISTMANSADTMPTNTAHSRANQNVRICQRKCDSSHVLCGRAG